MTYQVLVDALVEPPLLGAALPQLLVAVLEAEPVPAELVQAVRVDVLEPVLTALALAHPSHLPPSHPHPPSPLSHKGTERKEREHNIHARSAPRDPPPLLQALNLPPATRLGLALHVVIVVVAAPSADEERGREKRGRRRANLLDGRDRVG